MGKQLGDRNAPQNKLSSTLHPLNTIQLTRLRLVTSTQTKGPAHNIWGQLLHEKLDHHRPILRDKPVALSLDCVGQKVAHFLQGSNDLFLKKREMTEKL